MNVCRTGSDRADTIYMSERGQRHKEKGETEDGSASGSGNDGEPSPTGVFVKTVAVRWKRAHPPPWEENCVMSCFGSASPD